MSRLNGDAEAAKELKQGIQSSWNAIAHESLPDLQRAKTKLDYGNLGYGEFVTKKMQEIMQVMQDLQKGVRKLPDYIRLLEKQ